MFEGVVAKMLECNAKVDGNGDRMLPLNVACRNNHASVVRLLLDSGANANLLELGESRYRRALPLHIAADNKSSELVDLLLKHGADVDMADVHGSTALHYGVEKYHRYSAKAKTSAKSVVDILLENRADVNILNSSGETPLFGAVSRGLLDVVSKMLQTHGGNPNISSSDKNALVVACERQNVELVDMLLKHEADPNLQSASCDPKSKYRLPLCAAAEEGNCEIIALLMKAGASVNAINHEDKSAMCIAIGNMTNARYRYYCTENTGEELSAIRFMLDHGADLNVLMPDGRSLLCLVVTAIGEGQMRGDHLTPLIDLLQLMVKHGVILSDYQLGEAACRRSPETLKALAAFDGRHQFIIDLLKAGAGFQLIALCCDAVSTSHGEWKSIRLCQAAVLAGYTPNAGELQSLQLAAASENRDLVEELVNWLNEDRQQVSSLFRQCRVAIRRQLSLAVHYQTILPAIDQLPLPNNVKLYLQFEGRITEVDLSINKELCTSIEASAENRRQLISPPRYAYSDYDLSDSEDYNHYTYDSDNDYFYHGSDSDEYGFTDEWW